MLGDKIYKVDEKEFLLMKKTMLPTSQLQNQLSEKRKVFDVEFPRTSLHQVFLAQGKEMSSP